jgi:cytochrome P450
VIPNPCRGRYDRDDPFPVYARVRADGPVHEVTLPGGQQAWLVMRYAEARALLNDPRLSKDMHAALAHDGAMVAEGLPGPAFARHMLGVDPPDHTRLRGLAAPAFTRSRVEALRPRIEAIVDGLLVELESRGDTVDLVAGFAFPLPFTVISELLGIPEPDRAAAIGRSRGLGGVGHLVQPVDEDLVHQCRALLLYPMSAAGQDMAADHSGHGRRK